MTPQQRGSRTPYSGSRTPHNYSTPRHQRGSCTPQRSPSTGYSASRSARKARSPSDLRSESEASDRYKYGRSKFVVAVTGGLTGSAVTGKTPKVSVAQRVERAVAAR